MGPENQSPAVKRAMGLFHQRLAKVKKKPYVLPLSLMDTLTKSVICAARCYVTAKDPAKTLPYLKRAVKRFEAAHEKEMLENLMKAIFPAPKAKGAKKGGKK